MTLCCGDMYTFWRYRESKIEVNHQPKQQAQPIIPISTFFDCVYNFTVLTHAFKVLIFYSLSNNFFEANAPVKLSTIGHPPGTSLFGGLPRSSYHFIFSPVWNPCMLRRIYPAWRSNCLAQRHSRLAHRSKFLA